VVSVDLPPHPSSATRARRIARESVSACPPDIADTVALLVTELVTNAILHARTDLHLDVEIYSDRVRLRVEDRSARAPVVKHYDTDDATGRGLALVEMLANTWGIDYLAGGKVVWCEVVFPAERT
jgi:anti-sigma regulatory factor (Ser/Thr protein kinase)